MNEAAWLLRHARKRAGLTQRALAAKVGVPQSYVARVASSAVDLLALRDDIRES